MHVSQRRMRRWSCDAFGIAPNCCGAICAAGALCPRLPVEYIVETTAKCNLYCPMCPRETHKQPKEDMTDEIFERLVQESRRIPPST